MPPSSSATPRPTRSPRRAGSARRGYVAAKFGWGPYGLGSVADDAEQVAAAREGLGEEGIVLVDAGTVWGHDVAAAERGSRRCRSSRVTWLEEPFVSGALDAYRALADRSGDVRIAGGEGSHNEDMARHMIDHGGVGFIQIDAGRIGGITPAKRVADYARRAASPTSTTPSPPTWLSAPRCNRTPATPPGRSASIRWS